MPRSTVLRIVLALGLAATVAAQAAAETGEPPARRLEAVWRTAVPGKAEEGYLHGWRVRIQRDNGISLAAGNTLVTLDASGKIRRRAVLPLRAKESYSSIPLEGGDFLVQPSAADLGSLRLVRVTADGAARFTAQERLHPDVRSFLHDAVLMPNGRIVAAVSYGPGPNGELGLLVFDAAGRRLGDHRTVIFMPASEGLTRVFPRESEGVSVLGMASRPSGYGPFQKSYAFAGDVPVATEAEIFTERADLRCSAMNASGAVIVAAGEGEDAVKPITLRWFDYAGDQTEFLTVGAADRCQIAMRADGASLVWLAPRTLLAFDGAAKPLWRADLPEDAAAVAWLSDGDVVAVHQAARGTAVVRYLAQ